MPLQVRRLLAVCAFSFVVVASVATSPPPGPPFGLSAEVRDSVRLTPAAPRVTRTYTATLNAAGNAGITDGGMPLVATLRLSGGFGAFDPPPSLDAGAFDGGALDGGESDGGSLDGGERDGGSLDGGDSDGGSLDGGDSDGGSVRHAFALIDDRGRVFAFARLISPNGAPVDAEAAALFVGCPVDSACEQQVTVELSLDPSANTPVSAVLSLEATATSGALSPTPAGASLTLTSP